MIETHRPFSPIEQRLSSALERLGITHKSQAEFGNFTVDEYLPDYNIAIEADGCTWHGCPSHGYPHISYAEQITIQAMRRARRNSILKRRYGLKTVVHIWGHNLTSTDAAATAVEHRLILLGIRT